MSGVLTLPANEVGPPESSPRPARVRMLTSPQGGERVVYYEGERIYFRPIEIEDEPRVRSWINDPLVRKYLHHRPPLNAFREREWIESQGKSSTDYVFGIAVRQGGRLIGTTGLHRIDAIARKAEFGLCIGDKAFQGRGYGKEATRLTLRFAFEELNLNRVKLHVFADNWRAIRLYQKVGFVQEGCLRQAAYRQGRYDDVYVFSILRDEWEARQNMAE